MARNSWHGNSLQSRTDRWHLLTSNNGAAAQLRRRQKASCVLYICTYIACSPLIMYMRNRHTILLGVTGYVHRGCPLWAEPAVIRGLAELVPQISLKLKSQRRLAQSSPSFARARTSVHSHTYPRALVFLTPVRIRSGVPSTSHDYM